MLRCFLLPPLLQNLLTASPHLAPLLASPARLAPLFGCLGRGGEGAELALGVMARLTQHASCVSAMVGDKGELLKMMAMLQWAVGCRWGGGGEGMGWDGGVMGWDCGMGWWIGCDRIG